MRSDELDARIDAALKQGPQWEPPREFAQHVAAAAMADRSIGTPSGSRSLPPRGTVAVARPALWLALAGCGIGLTGGLLGGDVVLVAWMSAGLTWWTAVTFVRRAGASGPLRR